MIVLYQVRSSRIRACAARAAEGERGLRDAALDLARRQIAARPSRAIDEHAEPALEGLLQRPSLQHAERARDRLERRQLLGTHGVPEEELARRSRGQSEARQP